MKTVQKLELLAGIATIVAPLILVLKSVLFPKTDYSEVPIMGMIVGSVYFLGPPALTFVGSYLHVIRQSNVGLVMLYLFGGLIILPCIFFTLYGFLAGSLIKFYDLPVLLPSLFALITIILALRSRKETLNKLNSASRDRIRI